MGSVFNAIAWPGAFLMMALTVWLPSRRSDLLDGTTNGFLLPGLAAVAGLGIVLTGTRVQARPRLDRSRHDNADPRRNPTRHSQQEDCGFSPNGDTISR